jgi:nucleotide-binding universal stress UspA family protein
MIWLPVVAWLLVGLIVAVVMIRRGHNPVIWLALSFYGPLLIMLALSARETEHIQQPVRLAVGQPGPGDLDVLVGLDGSDDSLTALEQVAELTAGRLHRLTLATVVDHDVAEIPDPEERHADASAILDEGRQVARRCGHVAETVVLTGKPIDALAEHTRREEFDLVAVGAKGKGRTRLLLGRVASHLPAHAEVPVLVTSARSHRTDTQPATTATSDP